MSFVQTKYSLMICGFVFLLCLAENASGQQRADGPGRRFGAGIGRGAEAGIPGIAMVDLLRQDAVRKELELLGDQVSDLEKLGEEFRGMMRDFIIGLRERREQGRPAEQDLRQSVESVRAKVEGRLEEILLPHQMKRLRQLEFQARLRGGGVAILSDDVGKQLGISDGQREQLRAKASQVEQEMRKKIAELRRQAHGELIALLDPEQQAKYRELVGAPFEFPAPNRPAARAGGLGRRLGGQER